MRNALSEISGISLWIFVNTTTLKITVQDSSGSSYFWYESTCSVFDDLLDAEQG